MTFVDELRQIYQESKAKRKELEEAFENKQLALAKEFVYGFLFPKIKEEFLNTPWVKQFSIEIVFSDGTWYVRNDMIPLGKTSDYTYHIAPYIHRIAHEEGVKHTEWYKNEKDEYCVALKFMLK